MHLKEKKRSKENSLENIKTKTQPSFLSGSAENLSCWICGGKIIRGEGTIYILFVRITAELMNKLNRR